MISCTPFNRCTPETYSTLINIYQTGLETRILPRWKQMWFSANKKLSTDYVWTDTWKRTGKHSGDGPQKAKWKWIHAKISGNYLQLPNCFSKYKEHSIQISYKPTLSRHIYILKYICTCNHIKNYTYNRMLDNLLIRQKLNCKAILLNWHWKKE